MIETIHWPDPQAGEPPSPFLHGEHKRPLKITFHNTSLLEVLDEDAEALAALHELSDLPDIQAFQTEPGKLPHIKVGDLDEGVDQIPVSLVEDGHTITSAAIGHLHQLRNATATFVGKPDRDHPDFKTALNDLLIARAHTALRQDVLVTGSRCLLDNRTQPIVGESNPRTPSEAAQLVGLFLRSRGNYTYSTHGGAQHVFDRGLFYWVLTRHRLPSMWRYFSACVQAEQPRGDDILFLGQSVLTRCVRALQARDAIGEQFYVPQGNNARDTMMYHFDYLTLVLSGALDAQARVAHRAYRIRNPKERYAYFDKQQFQMALKNSGAEQLYDLVSAQAVQNLTALLNFLRNTVHGAGLPSVAYQHFSERSEASFVSAPRGYGQTLWQVFEQTGFSEKWGLKRDPLVMFEPYSCASGLLFEMLKLIDKVASTTDVVGLFPIGHAVTPLTEGPPENGVFGERIRKRLAVLG